MPEVVWFVVPALTAAAASALLTPLVGSLALRVGAVDLPGSRKIHTVPVPRLGGLAVIASIALVFAAASWIALPRWELPHHLAIGVAVGWLPILLVSLADDVKAVPAILKLVAHLAGAVVAVSLGITLGPTIHLFGTPIHISSFAGPLSVLWLVGVTNAFNIIDGLDGLSAGLALISAVSMAAVFVLVGQPAMGGVCLVLAGALAGFLPYNVYPARLFLGDTGATGIGFCLAAFSLEGGSTLSSGFAALLPVFILGLPIADTLISMLRRALRRLEHRVGGVFVADSNHIHHRLLALGVDHRKAVMILYGAGFLLALAAFASIFLNAAEAASFMFALLVAAFVGVQRLGYDEFAFIRRGAVLRMYEVPLVKRGLFIVFVDLALALATAYISLGLKADTWGMALVAPVTTMVSTFAPVTVLGFWWGGMYRGAWRVAGIQDLTAIVVSVAVSTLAGAVILAAFSPGKFPASVFIIYGLVNLTLTAAVRTSYVVLHNTQLRAAHRGMPIVVYGAGRRGATAVRELFQDSHAGLSPVGFIDDDTRKRHRLVCGLPVLGTASDLEALLATRRATAVLIASPKIPSERVSYAIEMCHVYKASLFRLDLKVEPMGAPTPDETLAAPEKHVSAHLTRSPSPAISGQAADAVCPSCSCSSLQPSRARSLYERLRRRVATRRIFRCRQCGWRGWLHPCDEPMTAAAIEQLIEASRSAHLDDIGEVLTAPQITARHRSGS